MQTARAAVTAAVEGGKADLPAISHQALEQPAGAFVTLHCQGELRGCIGLIEPTTPLWQTVSRAATSAATEDFRFAPLQPQEVPQLCLEISVLSPPEKVADPSEIRVCTHGLIAEQGLRRGLLLPQVAREWGWDREEFLGHTCEKAGLPPLAWMQGATIYCFTAEVFGEEKADRERIYLHLDHEQALALLGRHLTTPNLVKHCLAAEAVLDKLAHLLEQDEANWRLCGLLHDIDYDLTASEPTRHTLLAEEILLQAGINGELIEAVKGHNDLASRDSLLAKALWAVDPLTGFLVAAALVAPEKKLAAIDVPFVLNRMKEKSFARGASREQIAACAQLGLSLESFIAAGLEAMQQIAPQLGL